MEYFDYDAAAEFFLERSHSDDIDVKRLLEWSQQSESERIEHELDRIKRELEEREVIHQTTVEELERKVDRCTEQLQALYTGFSRIDEEKRIRFKTEIASLYQELRRERRQNWQDRQSLHQERRALLRELEEVEEDVFRYLH